MNDEITKSCAYLGKLRHDGPSRDFISRSSTGLFELFTSAFVVSEVHLIPVLFVLPMSHIQPLRNIRNGLDAVDFVANFPLEILICNTHALVIRKEHCSSFSESPKPCAQNANAPELVAVEKIDSRLAPESRVKVRDVVPAMREDVRNLQVLNEEVLEGGSNGEDKVCEMGVTCTIGKEIVLLGSMTKTQCNPFGRIVEVVF